MTLATIYKGKEQWENVSVLPSKFRCNGFEVTTEKYSLNPVILSPTSPTKSAALWSLYCVFDPIMICLYVLTVLIFMTIWRAICYFNPYFIYRKTDTEKLGNLPKDTQPLWNRARILAKEEWLQSHWKLNRNSRLWKWKNFIIFFWTT